MKKQKKETLQLDAAQQRRAEIGLARAAAHRGTTLSLKFKEADIDKWRSAAEASTFSLTAWIEAALNKAADQQQ